MDMGVSSSPITKSTVVSAFGGAGVLACALDWVPDTAAWVVRGVRVVGLAGGGVMVREEATQEVWYDDLMVAKEEVLLRRPDGSERGRELVVAQAMKRPVEYGMERSWRVVNRARYIYIYLSRELITPNLACYSPAKGPLTRYSSVPRC